MKSYLYLYLLLCPFITYAQPGSTIVYSDEFSPPGGDMLPYDGLKNGKHSWRDPAIPLDVLWSAVNNRWEVIYADDPINEVLFHHVANTAQPPQTTDAPPPLGGWEDSDAGDGTTLGSLTISGLLPVTFTAFSGKAVGEGVVLDWATAVESNNRGFEVQRSIDGRDFVATAFVEGTGNSSVRQTYSYTDTQPGTGQVYYRLRQVDLDERYDYSDVVTVLIRAETPAVAIWPNPAVGHSTLQMRRSQAGTLSLRIHDMAGRLYHQSQQSVSSGTYSLPLPVADLPAGSYIVSVRGAGVASYQRLVRK